MQEYKERTERIKDLREEFTTASTDLQTLTTAVEEKKVSCMLCLRLMEESKLSLYSRQTALATWTAAKWRLMCPGMPCRTAGCQR